MLLPTCTFPSYTLRVLALGVAMVCPLMAEAGDVTYRVRVVTATSSGAGTDNNITFRLENTDTGEMTRWATLQGHQENGDDEQADYSLEDIGTPNKIVFDVDGALPDKWAVHYVVVEVHPGGNVLRSSSRFNIGKELDFDPNHFTTTSIEDNSGLKQVGTTKSGTREINIVKFADNTTGSATHRSVGTTESWRETFEIGVAHRTGTEFEAGVKASVKYGGGAAEVGAEVWASLKLQAESDTSYKQILEKVTTQDYSFDVSPGQACLRRLTVEVSVKTAEFKSPNGDVNTIVWPVGYSVEVDQMHCMPSQRGQMSYAQIESEFLQYMSASARRSFDSYYGRTSPSSPSCSYAIDIARADTEGVWKTITTTGAPGSTFRVGGCTTSTATGQSCISKYNVAGGSTLIVDQRGRTVGEGTCCHSPENSITDVRESCP